MTMRKSGVLSFPVVLLFLLSFFLGTSEFIVVGILPEIADGLGISLAAAGTAVSVFAFAYAIGTPLFSAYAGRFDRKPFMLSCVILFIAFNVLCGLATSYALFTICRLVFAILSGTILSISMAYANELASDENKAQVISLVFTGFSAASVFGVPIAASLCQIAGWRAVFIIVAIMTAILLPLMKMSLPHSRQEKSESVIMQLRLFTNRKIILCLLTVIFTAASTYAFYTYFSPLLQEEFGIGESHVSIALFFYGIAALVSNILSGYIAKKRTLYQMSPIFLIQALFLALLFIATATGNPVLAFIDILAIGILMYLVNAPSQLYFLSTAAAENSDCVSLASSLCPVCFNLGIALGSSYGSLVMDKAGYGMLGPAGAVFAVLAVLSSAILRTMEMKSRSE